MSHRSKVTGKYLHSTVVVHKDLDGKEQEYLQYTWESEPESYEFPHNNKTLIKVTNVENQK